jgi:hypothetical protein
VVDNLAQAKPKQSFAGTCNLDRLRAQRYCFVSWVVEKFQADTEELSVFRHFPLAWYMI